jgi:hypothetical protein
MYNIDSTDLIGSYCYNSCISYLPNEDQVESQPTGNITPPRYKYYY